jgi:HPt (histidine-containing phosphotransfer) domain-containing protein
VQAIDAALRADDTAGLVRPAHTLKSSSATLGAMRIADTARGWEMAGRSDEPAAPDATAEVLVTRLRDDWTEAITALREWATAEEAR